MKNRDLVVCDYAMLCQTLKINKAVFNVIARFLEREFVICILS